MDRLLRSVDRRTVEGARRGALRLLFVLVAIAGTAGCSRTGGPPLAHTFDSPEQLAAAVAAAIERNDADRLLSLALTEQEFRWHVWPRLPASRAERGVPFGLVWGQLYSKSRAYLRQTLAAHGGRRLHVVRVRFRGDATDHGAFRVRREAEVVVRDENGAERSVRLFGSVLEQGGRYKLFSYVVD